MNDIQLNNLSKLRHNIRRLLEKRQLEKGQIWTDAWVFLKYIIDLNDSDTELIGLHSSFLGGQQPFTYWHPNPNIEPARTAEVVAYMRYTENIGDKFCISAPIMEGSPRQHGIIFNDKIINSDIVRFQSAISNLFTIGIFDILKKENHLVICEVGSGFGGLAFHISKIFEKSTYLLVDIPETLFMAGAYLIVNDPAAKIYIYDENEFSKEFFANNHRMYDYMLIPDFALPDLEGGGIDLFINMLSFQEMTEEVIDDYVRFAYNHCKGFLYSDNWSKHPYNKQIKTSVEDIICKYFDVFPSIDVYDNRCFGDAFTRSGYQELKVFVGRSKKEKEMISLSGYIKVLRGTARIDGVHKTRNGELKAQISFEEPLWKRKSTTYLKYMRTFLKRVLQ